MGIQRLQQEARARPGHRAMLIDDVTNMLEGCLGPLATSMVMVLALVVVAVNRWVRRLGL